MTAQNDGSGAPDRARWVLSAMRIAEIHVFAVPLPVKGGPYTMANAEVWSLELDGREGGLRRRPRWLGRDLPGRPHLPAPPRAGRRAALAEMAPGLIGADPLGPVALRRRMDGLPERAPLRQGGHRHRRPRPDGQALRDAVADLLGGAVTERVPSYYAIGRGRARRDRPHRAGQGGGGLPAPPGQDRRSAGRDRHRGGAQGLGAGGQAGAARRGRQPRPARPGTPSG